MKTVTRNLFAVLAVGSLLAGLPTAAQASGEQESPVPGEVVTVPAPSTLTDAEMAALSPGSVSLAAPSSPGPSARAANPYRPLCTLDIGNVYKRTSGGKYKYGTVGAKPSTKCTGNVPRIEQSTAIYRKTAGGWAKITGDFFSFSAGVASLTQKNIEYVCKSYSKNDYKVVTLGAVWYPGLKPVSGGAYEISNGKLACG